MSEQRQSTLLVVDDNPTNLRVICAFLAEKGFRLLTAESGESALRRMERSAPDLVLMDVMMPGMDGFETVTKLREQSRFVDVPVIFMTALDDTPSKLKGFASGGMDYISKPLQYEELLARIQTHLELHRLKEALRREIAQKNALIAELHAYDHTVAHDLKNPIAGIIIATQAYRQMDDVTTEETEEIIDMIEQSAGICSAMIGELLTFATLRQEEITLGPTDVYGALKRSTDRLSALIRESGAEITMPASLPSALGYGPWLEEVWANLISNAIKYGGEPPRIKIVSRPLGPSQVQYLVMDNGEGLRPGQPQKLFDPFVRAHSSIGGFGLGLSIVRRVVQRLGGSVEAGNRTDAPGAQFSFTLRTTVHD
ncbi:response regulator [Ruficoccus amylovorans]|uniref:histidine kinase n=1 Tax=Ruficoccus amylovorans TaxID=1804625 RepID=A0A842HG64_9BACT|nr:response regulator [Ruficoccus amylovorans]MBC2595402.1 response regulator [Ruficoccus amylovorans]